LLPTDPLEPFLVGHKLDVFTEEGIEGGRITAFDPGSNQHLIAFESGEDQWVSLKVGYTCVGLGR
jgi:hypothetical protein